MKYQIHSINDKRLHYKQAINRTVSGWENLNLVSVNGTDPEQLQKAQERHPYVVADPQIREGQLGIWYSFLDALKHAPLITFDDDALLGPNFELALEVRMKELPDDAHFFSLFIPRDSDHKYDPSKDVGKFVTRTYSKYGGVSFYFTEKGKRKIRTLLKADGIRMQYDDQLYAYARMGDLNGYCSKPEHDDLVYITGHEESIVQESPVWQRKI